MFCSNCGEKIAEEAKFCPFCGKQVLTENIGQKIEEININEEDFDINDDTDKAEVREYALLDNKLRIRENYLNYVSVHKHYKPIMEKLLIECAEEITQYKSDTPEDLSTFLNSIGTEYTKRMAEDCFDIFSQNNIYTIRKEELVYYVCEEPREMAWKTVVRQIKDDIRRIDNYKREEEKRRENRKVSRGHFVGGGFGVSGAIKGAVMASALNAVTGAAHSVANTVGNTATAFYAQHGKQSLLKNKDYVGRFIDSLYESFEYVLDKALELVNQSLQETKYDSISEACEDKAYAMQQNLCENRVKDEQRKTVLIQAMETDPSNIILYGWFLFYYPEESKNLQIILDDLDVKYEDVIWVLLVECYVKEVCSMEEDLEKYYQIDPGMLSVKQINQLQIDVENVKKQISVLLQPYHLTNEEITYFYSRLICELSGNQQELIEYHKVIFDLVIADGKIAYGESRPISDLDELLSEKEKQEKVISIFKKTDLMNLEEVKNAITQISAVDKLGWADKVATYLKDIIVVFGDQKIEAIDDAVEIKSNIYYESLNNYEDCKQALKKIDVLNISEDSRSIAIKVIVEKENSFIKEKADDINKQLSTSLEVEVEQFTEYVNFLTENANNEHCLEEMKTLKKNLIAVEKHHGNRLLEMVISIIVFIGIKIILLRILANFPSVIKNIINIGGNIFIVLFVIVVIATLIGNRAWRKAARNTCRILHSDCNGDSRSNLNESEKDEKLIKKCSFCGNKIESDKKFCSKCGKPILGNSEVVILCPKCGNEIKNGKKFCNKCGMSINAKEED